MKVFLFISLLFLSACADFSSKNKFSEYYNIDSLLNSQIQHLSQSETVNKVTYWGDVYEEKELNSNKSGTTLEFRQRMSEIAFTETAYYDGLISNYFISKSKTTEFILSSNFIGDLKQVSFTDLKIESNKTKLDANINFDFPNEDKFSNIELFFNL